MDEKPLLVTRQARLEVVRWLICIVSRRHGVLSYRSPMEFDQQRLKTVKLSLAV
ncbi:hypothetical protein GCM10010302_00870 [Streptomyces polychromogenes]|uniref:Transposase n=1 Tax=Streptomyces polychromogenes TaxID=67342 RepID=A0ABN0UZ18_9ACTN